MFKYTCDRCSKSFKKKSNYTDHVNKKYSCILINGPAENGSLNGSQLLPSALPGSSNSSLKEPTQDKNSAQTKNDIQEICELQTKLLYSCPNCNSTFTKKGNLNRHMKNICSDGNNVDNNNLQIIEDDKIQNKITTSSNINSLDNSTNSSQLDGVLEGIDIDDKTRLILQVLMRQNSELLKEINLLKNTNTKLLDRIENLERDTDVEPKNIITTNNITNTTNNLLNTTNNTNIILAHGKEELNKIELEQIMKCLSTIQFRDIIPNMTKHIYLNDDKPQNKNFCVVDIARNKCKFYNGYKWLTGKSSEKINKIFDNVHNALLEPFEKENINKTIEFIKANPKKFSKKWIDYSKNFLENLYDEDEKDNREYMLNELKYIFYNNKDEILKSSK